MTTLLSKFQEGLVYKGGTGHWAFIFHRIAGLAILLFLTTHVIDTAWIHWWPAGYAHAVELYRSTPFLFGEIALVAAVIYHGLNGLKVIYLDRNPQGWGKANEAKLSWIVFGASFVLWLPAALLMARHLYMHVEHTPVTDNNATISYVNVGVLVLLGIGLSMLWGVSKGGKKVAVPMNFETRMYRFMRYSGVMLIPLAFGHVLIKDIIHGVHVIDNNYVALYWGSWGWRLYDLALLGFALAHGINGLKQVLEDYIHSEKVMQTVRLALVIAWLGIMLYGGLAIVLFSEMYQVH
jgi:succinate dehydrogenase cytochrome b556 subunit